MELLHLRPDELAPYAPGLCALEAAIRYPVGEDDHFAIDHGADYHPFFSEMGDAHFMVGVDGDRVFASLAGVFRAATIGPRRISTVYLGDFKIDREYRGRQLGRKMGVMCLKLLWRKPELRRWRLAYGAAMRGERGDVTRSLGRFHPGRLMSPLAELALYFVSPEQLRGLGDGPPAPPDNGLDLGGTHAAEGAPLSPVPLTVSTAGRKDLRLESTGAPWPLVHLPQSPQHWVGGLGGMLAQAAEEIPTDALACFGVDRRLDDHTRWLRDRGLGDGATCTIYALSYPGTVPADLPWVHLAPSEI